MTIADYFNAPVIDEVDLTNYNMQPNSIIRIAARDDFGVASVHVTITTPQGAVLESGNAVETASGSGQWLYTTTTNVSAEPTVNVQVVATDLPGGTAVTVANKGA